MSAKQYSEDDTFDKLRRCSMAEMAAILTNYCKVNGIVQVVNPKLELLLKAEGWTKEAYLGEVRQIEIRLGIINERRRHLP